MCPLHISWGIICITNKWEAATQILIFAQVESPIPLCPVWDGRQQHVPCYLGETEGWGLCLPEEGGFEHVRPSRRPRRVYLPLSCPRINSTLALGSFCPRIIPPVLAGWAWALAGWLAPWLAIPPFPSCFSNCSFLTERFQAPKWAFSRTLMAWTFLAVQPACQAKAPITDNSQSDVRCWSPTGPAAFRKRRWVSWRGATNWLTHPGVPGDFSVLALKFSHGGNSLRWWSPYH